MNKEIKEIQNIIKEVRTCSNIDNLLDYSLKATAYLMYLHEQEAEAKKVYLDAYNERKLREAEFTLASGSGVTKAQSEAIIQAKEFREQEAAADYAHELLRGYRNSLSNLCDVLAQKISHLKKQFELNQFRK